MPVIKTDGYVANGGTGRPKPQTAKLWVTDTTVTEGQWIAQYAGDTTSPSGLAGDSYRIADANNADALYGTIGVAQAGSLVAGTAGYIDVIIQGFADTMNMVSGSTTVGADLIINADAGKASDIGAAATNGAAYRIIGRCLTDGGSDSGSGWVYLHPQFAGIV